MNSEPANNQTYPLVRHHMVQIRTAIEAAHRLSLARDELIGANFLDPEPLRSHMTILQAKALEILTGAIDGYIENETDLIEVEIHLDGNVVKLELHMDELTNGYEHWASGSEPLSTGDDRLEYVQLKITRGVGQKKND